MSSWFAKSLYMLLIIHSDDYGVIDGDAEEIKWKVLPAVQESPEEIESAMEQMQQMGLIHRYSWQGHSLTEIIQFDSYQQGLHKRTARKFPEYQAVQGQTGNLEQTESSFPEIPGKNRNIPEDPASRARADVYVYKDKDKDKDKEHILSGKPDAAPPCLKKKNATKQDGYASQKEAVISHLNALRGSSFRPNSKACEHISARLGQGFTVEDCLLVVEDKIRQWKADPKMVEYLRPETLFSSEHFEAYLQKARENCNGNYGRPNPKIAQPDSANTDRGTAPERCFDIDPIRYTRSLHPDWTDEQIYADIRKIDPAWSPP